MLPRRYVQPSPLATRNFVPGLRRTTARGTPSAGPRPSRLDGTPTLIPRGAAIDAEVGSTCAIPAIVRSVA